MGRMTSNAAVLAFVMLAAGASAPAQARSCFGITNADLALSQRTIANACARGTDDCYGEARRWQNIVKYFNGNVCPDADRALFNEHNAAVRRIVSGLGRDTGRVGRYNQAVRDYNRPRGYGGSPAPAPANPNPSGLYGRQPNWAYCSNYSLNVDGSKFCY